MVPGNLPKSIFDVQAEKAMLWKGTRRCPDLGHLLLGTSSSPSTKLPRAASIDHLLLGI